ncbi:DUF2156 domain-containing protein [[Eubacterium] cellulosolvens]
MVELADFKPLGLEDKDFFMKHYSMFPPPHSDYSFTTMLCWNNYVKYFCAQQNGNVVLMTKMGDRVQFRPPIGAPDPNLDHQVLKLASQLGDEPPFGMVNSEAITRLKMTFPKMKFEPDRDYYDYVYLASDLVQLAGKKYIKIRNILNRFRRNYEYEVEPITPDNISAVSRFLERWCLWKDCDKVPLLKNEKLAVEYCMAHFFDLALSGIVIKIDDNIEAASIFEPLNPDTAVIHFEKAIPDFEGLYQAINQEAAQTLAPKYSFINRESDMGFPGLRLAKEKYRPDHMVEVYHLNKAQLDLYLD